MTAIILKGSSETFNTHITTGYVAGVIIAILILGYLVYTLIRPEKF